MAALISAIRYIRDHEGQFPPTLDSKEDENELGQSGVPCHVVQMMHEKSVEGNLIKRDETDLVLCFVDGLLLYTDPAVIEELDIRLLLRAPYEKLKARRQARSGYVTLDGSTLIFNLKYVIPGFWEDPPEYFDKIVWKWYAKNHESLFQNNDINGCLRENRSLNLQTPVQLDLSMQDLLVWAMGVILNYLQTIE